MNLRNPISYPMRTITYLLLFAFCLLIQPVVVAAEQSASADTAIEGLCLEKIEGGEKVYSIEAEKAAFGNKRIGFFDICLIKVINLQDVRVLFFESGKITKTQTFPAALYEINTKRLLDEKGNIVIGE